MAKYSKMLSLGYDATGKRIRKRVYGNSQKQLEQNERLELMKWREENNVSSSTSFGTYAKRWLQTYKSKREVNTVEYYQTGLDKLADLNPLKLSEIKKINLQGIIQDNWEHPRTCKKLNQILGSIFESAMADGLILKNPAAELELPKEKKEEKRILSAAEKAAAKSVSLPPMERLFLDLEMYLGLRPEETRALNRSSFNLKKGTVSIVQAATFDGNNAILKDTKTGKHRTLPLPDVLIAEIRAYTKAKPSFYLFVYEGNKLMSKSSFRKFSERIFKAINVELGGTDTINVVDHLTWYTFRHSRGTELYYLTQRPDGISTKMAANYMGHSETVFLNCYSHIDIKKEKVELLKMVL